MAQLATPPPTAAAGNLLTADETAAKLNISKRTLWRMRDRGALPAPVKLGVLVRWSDVALDAWITGGCRPVARASR